MPGCQLPLNIFEPRYLAMVFDALRSERLIGMVQVDPAGSEHPVPSIYRIGTCGRITAFSETGDGRLQIVLTGISRFRIRDELFTDGGYRKASVDWEPFRVDYETGQTARYSRRELTESLRRYFSVNGLKIDWEAMERLDDLSLCNVLVGALPWDVAERQSLVEATTLDERVEKMAALLQIGASPSCLGTIAKH
jgi:Lon protease-like protein